jgi:aminobenzoyl-glutamate transport protein
MNQSSFWMEFSARIERWGNRLPAPALLFIGLWLVVVVISSLSSWLEWSVVHPVTRDLVLPTPLLSETGVVWMLSSAVKNFTSFAPVGPVLVVMLGLGVAERSGLLGQWLQQLMRHLPGMGLTFGVVLIGILSSLAFDAGYVVVIPLSALLFQLAGRSPLAGIAASFAAVSGGYSANLMVGPVDTILAGISTESARLVDSQAEVSLVANYYFMAASTVFMSLVISVVLHRWVEPTLGVGDGQAEFMHNDGMNSAARVSLWFMLISVLILLAAALFPGGWLAGERSFIESPFMRNLSVLIGLMFGLAGWLFGRLTGRYRDGKALVDDLEETFRTLAPYLVLMFFASQFVAAFSWSNLGLLFAIQGASFLQLLALPDSMTLVMLILLVSLINLFVGSASAKWTLLAPVLVPMLMLVGISPDITQVAYRIGDSSTNIITPLMPYFPLVLALVQKYRSDAGVGTLMAMMMPFSLVMLCSWSVFLGLWLLAGIPLGPQ